MEIIDINNVEHNMQWAYSIWIQIIIKIYQMHVKVLSEDLLIMAIVIMMIVLEDIILVIMLQMNFEMKTFFITKIFWILVCLYLWDKTILDVHKNVFIMIVNINNKLKIIVALIVMINLFKCLQNNAQIAARDVYFFNL